ncbi:MAG: proliferating cell nuclear antigen (pcna) [Candidatus Bathyarchaeia archaeon]
MFSIKVADSKIIKDVFTAISTLVDEATFDVTPDRISLRAMDPSRVAMVDFIMQKTAFDEYNATENMKICVNMTELLKLLKRAGRDESVELSLDEKTAQLRVVIRGRYTRSFNMPTLEAAEEEIPTPNITFDARATLTTEGLRQALNDVALVSDHVRIETDGERLLMNARGDLMGANIEMQKGSDALLSVEAKERPKATFSLSYLTEIVKAAGATSDVVTIEFSTDMPIRLDFRQPYEGKLAYYLAPRIEVE